jgi:peptide/nickel transport system substrate-binding protein
MRRSARAIGVVLTSALCLAAGACARAQQAQVRTSKQGGKLTVLWAADVDHIDCGQTALASGAMLCDATQKPLYSYRPDDGTTLVPDLADGAPQVSRDGKTVTVKIKRGVRYSPPYQDHTVTSADVKYAIERGFFGSVAAGFTQSYYGDLVGARVGAKPGTAIAGITTPDANTLVLRFRRAVGGVMAAGALANAVTAPVPEAYAKPFDAEPASTYGEHQLATGPYMIANDATGEAIGYQPGKRIHLVRNPSWNRSLDFKPAYLDEIDNVEGNGDTGVASRHIIAGRSMIDGDFGPAPEVIKDALKYHKDQIVSIAASADRWIALNTTIKPFDDINVRKAVLAGMDRRALLLTRGGKAVGDVATHILPPGMPGFEQAGAMRGFGLDYLPADGSPNPAVSAKYFKAAGYASGKYEGHEKILMVASNLGVGAETAAVVKRQLTDLGFHIAMRIFSSETMFTRYCGVPASRTAICPSMSWQKDFADGQTMLDPTFNGKNIFAQGNSNWAELNDKHINQAMDAAEVLPSEQRPAAWAAIDRMVMEQAVVVPFMWTKQPLIESANVNGVASHANTTWDLAWTSLK